MTADHNDFDEFVLFAAAGTATVMAVASAVAVADLRSVGGSANNAGTPEAHPPAASDASASPGAPTPPVPTRCAVQRLPIPGGEPKSLVTGGDRTGRYILGRAYPVRGHNERHPLLIWDNGTPTTLSMPGNDEQFTDINSNGTAVGGSFGGDDVEVPYIYRNGAVSRLAVQGSARANAIGEQGHVVGLRRTGGKDTPRPVVWRDTGAPAVDLAVPAGWEGEATDVDADGTIVGWLTRGPGLDFRGYVWAPDGTGRFLPLPTVDGTPASAFAPRRIHNGLVVGRVTKTVDTGFAVLVAVLDLRTEAVTLLPATAAGGATNSLGWSTAGGPTSHQLITPAGPVELPHLVSTPTDPQSVGSTLVGWMSEDGRVLAGQAVDATGEIQAVAWRCT
jgi:hypothetical protein